MTLPAYERIGSGPPPRRVLAVGALHPALTQLAREAWPDARVFRVVTEAGPALVLRRDAQADLELGRGGAGDRARDDLRTLVRGYLRRRRRGQAGERGAGGSGGVGGVPG